MVRSLLSISLLLFSAVFSVAGPVTAEEAKRQAQVIEQLKNAIASEPKAEAKFALIAKAMKEERNADLRRRILETATTIPGSEIEPFLTTLLTGEEDAGLRSEAARLLGQRGSEKCLKALAQSAEKDKTTDIERGCIRGQSSARRAATFAIAELAARHPKLADEAAAKLRALPATIDPKDNESLGDARIQALYQITHDETLLKPFYARLKSTEVKERTNGVIAFRFLKIKQAPKEVVDALKDASPDVRVWAALVLGEIGDPKTWENLMAVSVNTKEDLGVRCNAIDGVGRMKIAAAVGQIEKLLNDPEPIVQTDAAIALYRITGKKVKQFPEGYKAD
ncbi:MAG TPA: HEAT repeat domain-containing protein [Gemmata sp.]|nr:HEAT repeat domain-containing protein [Gemmata sp.]